MEDSFCAAPFVGLVVTPKAQVFPCCYHFGYPLGSTQNDLATSWNGEKMQRLRTEFLQGKPRICKARMHTSQCHKKFAHWEPHVVREAYQKTLPQRLDLRLNGQCNLKCVMCEVWAAPNGLNEHSFVWSMPPSFYTALKEVEFLGGEPMIQKDTFRFLHLLKTHSATCRLRLVTNGHYQVKARIRDAFLTHPWERILVSIDTLKSETYQFIRGGDGQLVRRTLEFLLEHRVGRILAIASVVQKSNWQEIPDLLDFALQKGLGMEFQFPHHDPGGTSLATLGPKERSQVLDCLQDWTQHPLGSSLRPIVGALRSKDKSSKRGKGLQ